MVYKIKIKSFVRFDEMESVLCDWLGVVGIFPCTAVYHCTFKYCILAKESYLCAEYAVYVSFWKCNEDKIRRLFNDKSCFALVFLNQWHYLRVC